MSTPAFVIRGARVFNGHRVTEVGGVVVRGGVVAEVGRTGAGKELEVVEAAGMMLLPGLIDAHIHVRPEGLAELALCFGVTTVLDMGSDPGLMVPYRRRAQECSDLADIRSSSFAATRRGGHPTMLVGSLFEQPLPAVERPDDAKAFVDARIAEGADYIKLVIEDGAAFGQPMPRLDPATSTALVAAAHERGLLAVAHVHTVDAAWQAVRSGVDGLMHIWADEPAGEDLLDAIADAGVFVVPTLTLIEGLTGVASGAALATDVDLGPRLPEAWRTNLTRGWRLDSPIRFEHAVGDVRRLAERGVRLLAGTDSAVLGVVGTAPGASVHRELELLVDAGLAPTDALAAATSAPCDAFGINDRGRIVEGRRADLVLVEGDPTERITDSRRLRRVWRGGHELSLAM